MSDVIPTPSDGNETVDSPRELASDVLPKLRSISDAAKQQLDRSAPLTPGALVHPDNPLTGSAARDELASIGRSNREALQEAHRTPLVARVRFIDVDDPTEAVRTVYFGRSSQPDGSGLGNLRAPLGRLASIEAGDDCDIPLPGGTKTYEVVERALLKPRLVGGGWDARDTLFEAVDFSRVTIRSLRALLETIEEEYDAVAALLAAESVDSNILEGYARSILTRVSLRDQPVLDRQQDEIFRRPLNSQVLLVGPPGSGKTTTLIRRLGQKLDYLEEPERELVSASLAGFERHARSWLMFTPTKLLREYLKEAFAREGVPAPAANITTWDDHRQDLARRVFKLLRAGAGSRGTFMRLADGQSTLRLNRPGRLEDIADAFSDWQWKRFWSDLSDRAAMIASHTAPATARLGERLARSVGQGADRPADALRALANAEGELRELVSSQEQSVRDRARNLLNALVKSDRNILHAMATFLAEIARSSEEEDASEESEFEADDEPITGGALARAEVSFRLALIADARSLGGRRVSPKSRNGQLLAWLRARGLGTGHREDFAKAADLRTTALALLNPLRPYIDGFGVRYRRFRREMRPEQDWFEPALNQADTLIDDHELDVILLVALRSIGELFEISARSGPAIGLFEPMRDVAGDVYRSQILVDEATDFSSVQLGCMAALCDSATQSFFASGDFAQRLTTWGANDRQAFEWAVPAIDFASVKSVYRQSPSLVRFGAALATLNGDGFEGFASGNDHGEPAPALGVGLSRPEEIADWLCGRVEELLERLGLDGELPTIAVLMPSEGDLDALVPVLDDRLRPLSIRARACPRGEVRGQDGDVRVFDVQHIKGLEFEAVFFVSVDRLASEKPELFTKFLFVGATRAATFLGLTCEGEDLPPALASIAELLVEDWGATR